MLAKELKYGNDARVAMKAGVDKLANAVKVTLGPCGKYVVLTRPIGSPVLSFTLKFCFVTKVSKILVSVVHYELTPYQNS